MQQCKKKKSNMKQKDSFLQSLQSELDFIENISSKSNHNSQPVDLYIARQTIPLITTAVK